MRRPSRTGLAAAAGLVAGLAVAVGLLVGTGLGDRGTSRPRPEATAAFIAAFQRSLGATYVAKADYTRVLDDGRTLESPTFIAQRPPDRIQRQFGGITGTVAGNQVMCSTTPGRAFHCGPSTAAADPSQSLAEQLQNLQSYFTDPALYRVVEGDPGCFELTQVRPQALAPYGSSATICFDPATGAMSYLKQRLEGAVDIFATTEIRGLVSDQDFSLAQDNAYDSTSGGEQADLGLPPNDTSNTTTSAPRTPVTGG